MDSGTSGRQWLTARRKITTRPPKSEIECDSRRNSRIETRAEILAPISAEDGKNLSEQEIDTPPVFDGLVAAQGRLYASLEDGSLICLAGKSG